MGRYEEALKCYNKLSGINPDYVDVWALNNRGAAFSNLGIHEKALECYSKAIEMSGNDPILYCKRRFIIG